MVGLGKAQDDIVIRLRMKLMGLKKKVSQAKKEMRGLHGAALQSKMKKTAQTMGKVEKKTTQLNKAMGKWQPQFAGYALSLMFFGMALQRIFLRITKTAISTFQEISHQAGVSTTATDILQGSFKYLGFIIGQALQPVIEWLIPIVEKISEWVEENDKLSASLLGLLGALGTILMVGGMLKLALDGFKGLWAVLPGVVRGALSGIGTSIMGFIGAFWLPLTAFFAAIVLAWITDIGNFREMIKSNMQIIWAVITGVFKSAKKAVSGVWDALMGLMTGDFDRFWKGLINIVEGAIEIISKLLVGLGSIMANAFMFTFNVIVDAVANVIKFFIGAALKAVNAANSILPRSMQIGTSGLEAARAGTSRLQEGMKLDYLQGDTISNVINNIEINIDGNADEDTVNSMVDGINQTNPGGA